MGKKEKVKFSPEEPTTEEVEAARLLREKRAAKRKALEPEGEVPAPVVDSPDNDITSIRVATPEDPTGQAETIIDNNTPAEEDDGTTIS